ncbi:4Fe-4S cluster-binding domain-containing protein [Testudinibacter sp. P80/BLE/0925]|uniref:4Fe-4S cluster-binding domain-containing protein n=1 Tax=Testudinibacter sp. TW-1 TaxID=3417757 RepID=UPI003D35F11C
MQPDKTIKCGSAPDQTALGQIFVPLQRIIPFSNVEGSGNRISIFLQGCKLNCLYCHNPETIARYSADSSLVSLDYLYRQVRSSMPFIRGVTVSGGEPTIHHRKLVPFFHAVHELGLSCYLDSSGFFDFDMTQELIAVTDKFLFDVKGIGAGLQTLCLDRKNRAGLVSQQADLTVRIKPENRERNLNNLVRLLRLGKVEEVRVVLIKGYFDLYELLARVAALLKPYPEVLFKLIRVHAKGSRDPSAIERLMPTADEMNHMTAYVKALGIEKTVAIY